MSRRFEGAITTPEEATPDSLRPPSPRRPPRPLSIEIAAAVLIVGGFSAMVGNVTQLISADSSASDPGARPVVVLILGLNALTLAVGALVRRGQTWLLCINVVAVLLFIELTAIPSGSSIAALQAVLDGFVFVALARNRAWFEWEPPEEAAAR